MMENQYYCADCGAVDLEETSIEEWKKLYKQRHGKEFVEKRVLKWPYWC